MAEAARAQGKAVKFRAPAVVLLLFVAGESGAQTISYRPGFYRLSTEAEFVGRVRIESVSRTPGEACGSVREATVVESITGAPGGAKLRFVAQVEAGAWPTGTEAFAMLFTHALGGDTPERKCWVAAAPLFAAGSPASLVAFDTRAGQTLGGEFLPIGPENVLAGLRFSAIELWLDGQGRHFASWELVRAYARQTPAAVKALPSLSNEQPPPDVERPER